MNISKPIGVFLLVVFILLIGFIWNLIGGPCGVIQIGKSTTDLQGVFNTWAWENEAAHKASREEISSHISNLLRIEKKAVELDIAGCLEPAREELIAYMEDTIRGHEARYSEQNREQADLCFDEANHHKVSYINQLVLVQKCSPFCIK